MQVGETSASAKAGKTMKYWFMLQSMVILLRCVKKAESFDRSHIWQMM